MANGILATFHRYFARKRDDQISQINRESVIKGVYQDVEVSAGYFLLLSLANLIALCGLIVNSAPVIIGAMLISPLMGPILSSGFAFITGNSTIWHSALKKISLSVAVTLVVAAIAAWLSPLQEATSEILARTRPNLYDLIIATLAGVAGAVAICTKKNYLTIVPGVAIATAVIPPLSVAGFGIGTGNLKFFLGGFFLFFTNFVAIIFATCAVLFYYGFSPASDSYLGGRSLRKRVIYLAAVIGIISIPLVYTLHTSLAQVRLQKVVQTSLKKEFDREGLSRLASFTQSEDREGKLQINAVISTTKYLTDNDIAHAEKNLGENLQRPIAFQLEQLKVQPGGLKDEAMKPGLVPVSIKPRQPTEIVQSTRTETMRLMNKEIAKINAVIAPATVTEYTFGINSRQQEFPLELRLQTDWPLNAGQIILLERMIGSDLGIGVRLRIRTDPFFPELLFSPGETELREEMKKSLLPAKSIFAAEPRLRVTITTYPETSGNRTENLRSSRERAKTIAGYLTETADIPPERITTVIDRTKTPNTPKVKVTLVPEQEVQP
ncbi:MAG: TIGR00341 family protein [Deltaproteobacteria bacterium]|nr:TIGR00341 family protein [Deltaproteobacteria bacterium]TLN02356.1 MAG: TIGR00341 family protein [bacterium]